MIRRYSELKEIKTFEDRFEYLNLQGKVGFETFCNTRYLNQKFYTSYEWRNVRHHVIARDLGMDLGVDGYDIHSKILIHHMNPISPQDILEGSRSILDPEFLITTKHETHNAIHYGDASLLDKVYKPRERGDTRLW